MVPVQSILPEVAMRRTVLAFALAAAAWALGAPVASAQSCGNDASGFQSWKGEFAGYARAQGVGQRGLQALQGASYNQRTINADRNQRSFRLGLEEFMQKRGAATIVRQGRQMYARNRGFYDSLASGYGVSPGVLIAIHGMETGFGRFMGDSNVVSSILTLAYDCRRPGFFRPHALAALQLVDRGVLGPGAQGAMHGEWGHTQFLPANVLAYGRDGNGDGRLDLTNLSDAMASTANFLRGHGWRPGAGYQPGQPNFRVIEAWNAAGVYQQAIAIMAAQIEA
jgi:membrane-bound lytic murein transglycosylase B